MKRNPLRRISGAGNDAFPLAIYSEGYRVQQLQRYLNAWIAAWPTLSNRPATLVEDGKFGSRTQAALMWATGASTIAEPEYIRLRNTLSWTAKIPYAARTGTSTTPSTPPPGQQGNPSNLPPELRPTPSTTTTGTKPSPILWAGIGLLVLSLAQGGGRNG